MESLSARAESEHNKGNFEVAETLFEEVKKTDPNHPGSLINRARQLHEAGRGHEAINLYCDIILAHGDYPLYKAAAANNLGVLLIGHDKQKEAITAFEFALSLISNYAPARNNLGNVFHHQGDMVGALREYTEALRLDRDFVDAKLNCGTIQLMTGDFARGWDNYEYRWQLADWQTIPLRDPRRWNGEDLTDKRLLLTGEQGLGDAIHFVRFAPMIRDRFKPAELHYHGHAETVELFKFVRGGFDSISCIKDVNETDPSTYDFHCPLISLPRIFEIRLATVPSQTYIDLPGRALSVDHANLNVGIVWRGSPGHKKDKARSTTPNTFEPLADVPWISWHSLQYAPTHGEVPNWLTDLSGTTTTLLDLGKTIQDMDLIISVDTCVVHLAGAIGKPVWMLTPYSPDWRWMLEIEHSPWYPKLRLFRQQSLGDWSGVISRIKPELAKLSANHRIHSVPSN